MNINDEILLSVEKPGRYIGGEVNAVVKEKDRVTIRFALCFPDIYEIGMSHLGLSILYGLLNNISDVWCERVFSPWTDMEKVMRDESIPLFALESHDAVKDFDFLGITLQYELCYTNVLQILDLAGITIMATDRKEEEPLVIGGGPCAYNPEPVADFFDLFYIGEGESQLEEVINLHRKSKEAKETREQFLLKATQIPGIYVPRFYEVRYKSDGTIAKMESKEEGIPHTIKKAFVKDLTDSFFPTKPVVPFIKVTQDRIVLEIARGCGHGCRFCQAGHILHPVRERDAETLTSIAKEALANTGHDEINLSSLSASDYSQLGTLVDNLVAGCGDKINITLPSLRIDSFMLEIMAKVQDVRKSSLTFAPEAGSERLRAVIRKGLTRDDIIEGATLAFQSGWHRVKLYFMLGLPTESEEDVQAIGELANEIAAAYYDAVPKDKRGGNRIQIGVSTSFFIPKPFTPFQWAAQATKEEFVEKAYLTRQSIASQLNQKSIKYSWHETDASIMETVMARGDRRVGKAILKAYEKGARFDAWSEHYDHARWLDACQETGVDIDFFTTRARSIDEKFPWDFIDCGVSKEYLLKEWMKVGV